MQYVPRLSRNTRHGRGSATSLYGSREHFRGSATIRTISERRSSTLETGMKIRFFDKQTNTEITDLYWFEENFVHSLSDPRITVVIEPQICHGYLRPEGVLGGPCLECGRSQPEHTE